MPDTKPSADRLSYVLVTGAVILLALYFGLSQYLGAGRDDTFITLWAGENLAQGKGFINQNGERAEISSSLLHTLIVAALAKVAPHDIYTLNKLTGLAALCLTLWLIHRRRALLFPDAGQRFSAFCLVMVALASMPSFVYWSLSGLETPIVTLLLLALGIGYQAYWKAPGARSETALIVLQIVFLMVRPETFYILAFTVIFVLLAARASGWRAGLVRLIAIPSAFFLGLGLCRLAYFGLFFPNPVYAKTAGLFEHLHQGAHYIGTFYASSPLLLLLGVAAALLVPYQGLILLKSLKDGDRLKRTVEREPVLLLGLLVTVHLVVLFAGGDWMEFFRFMHPATPLLAIVGVRFLLKPLRRLQASYAIPGLFVLLFAAVWANHGQSSRVTSQQGPLELSIESSAVPYTWTDLFSGKASLDDRVKRLNSAYLRDQEILVPFLEARLRTLNERYGRLVIATPQMGLFPYLVKERFPDLDIRFIDTYGLCDPEVARLDLPSGSCGVSDGRQLARILSNEAGALSDHVLSLHPNMVYMLYVGHEEASKLEKLGYRALLAKPGANIFLNPNIRSTEVPDDDHRG